MRDGGNAREAKYCFSLRSLFALCTFAAVVTFVFTTSGAIACALIAASGLLLGMTLLRTRRARSRRLSVVLILASLLCFCGGGVDRIVHAEHCSHCAAHTITNTFRLCGLPIYSDRASRSPAPARLDCSHDSHAVFSRRYWGLVVGQDLEWGIIWCIGVPGPLPSYNHESRWFRGFDSNSPFGTPTEAAHQRKR
jgi:hypothetical protein